MYFSWKSSRASEASAEAAVQSAGAANISAGAAVRSADAAEKSAHVDQELLQIELRDRAAAEEELRRRPWSFEGITRRIFEATFNGEVAVDVHFKVINARLVQQRRDSNDGPIQNGEVFQLTVIPAMGFDNRIWVFWRETGGDGSGRSQAFSI
ncbi:hypothetical protein [Glycomyces tritici]|uniref:Tim44-like domain-containing protein n=1 Tax=Glycomyces tritici TaxID=2665176 RepID=A0ABT7YXW0_9ACTN|nr:hypothetical protein [Glycomyces tritici]MDN3243184.1 hypothetical protein [Glycomyces tritici]